MTRVLMTCLDPGIPWGGAKGASVHLEQLATALARENVGVSVVVTAVAENARTPEGVEVLRIPGPGKGSDATERLEAEVMRTNWLRRTAVDLGATVIYERLALHTSAASRAARCVGLPHIVELNAPLREEATRFRTLDLPEDAERLEGEVLRHAASVLAVSEPLVVYARGRGSTTAEQAPNAVNPAMFPKHANPDRDPPTVVFAGALRPWHGLEVLAEAWRILGDGAPELLVIGDGPGRHHLVDVGATLIGAVPHDRVPRLLTAAQIAVAPNPADTPRYFSPLKVFEYMAAGLPVVASDIPGTRSILGSGGLLVPAGDPDALADAVAGLVADPIRRIHMGHAGRNAVLANHTWARRARRVLEVAEALTNREQSA